MKKDTQKGFTLIEVIVTCVIAGIISLMAIPPLLSQISAFQVREDIKKVDQAVKEAKSSAITRSQVCYVDFSNATQNSEKEGGLIQVFQSNGDLISEVELSRNVLYNPEASTIDSDQIRFDFRGQPVDADKNPDNFTDNNNLVTISYYEETTPKHSRAVKILPKTGYTKFQ